MLIIGLKDTVVNGTGKLIFLTVVYKTFMAILMHAYDALRNAVDMWMILGLTGYITL